MTLLTSQKVSDSLLVKEGLTGPSSSVSSTWNRNGHTNLNHCDLGNLGVDLDCHGILEKGRNGL